MRTPHGDVSTRFQLLNDSQAEQQLAASALLFGADASVLRRRVTHVRSRVTHVRSRVTHARSRYDRRSPLTGTLFAQLDVTSPAGTRGRIGLPDRLSAEGREWALVRAAVVRMTVTVRTDADDAAVSEFEDAMQEWRAVPLHAEEAEAEAEAEEEEAEEEETHENNNNNHRPAAVSNRTGKENRSSRRRGEDRRVPVRVRVRSSRRIRVSVEDRPEFRSLFLEFLPGGDHRVVMAYRPLDELSKPVSQLSKPVSQLSKPVSPASEYVYPAQFVKQDNTTQVCRALAPDLMHRY